MIRKLLVLSGCDNSPYPASDTTQKILYTSFTEAPKTLDPAVAYTTSAHEFTGLIYPTLLEYHYLKRPYTLIPSLALEVPEAETLPNGQMRYRFELRHTESLTSIVDLVDVTVSNPDTLEGFKDIFLDDILDAVGDPVQRAQIIEDYTRPQFNNALRYTIRSSTSDPFRRENGHFREVALELGGNMGRILDDLVFTPNTIEGSLPGLGIFGGSGQGGRMIYRQYARLSVDVRKYHPMGSRHVFAWRVFTGIAHPTGASDIVPFDRRFYSGGANSVRAWRLRELGPGSARFTSDSDSLVAKSDGSNILGGDIKVEMSAELRSIMLRNLFSANWLVAVFADAGNVWLGPRNPGDPDGRFRLADFPGELGVGAGIGLRIGWEYIIVRLDMAYKMHDPRRQGDFMPDRFKKPVLQFGIGHTF